MVKKAKESPAELKLRAKKIYTGLNKLYPNAHCELDFKNPLQLLVATILAAQCTDKRVNMTTPAIFAKYPTPVQMSKASFNELFPFIKSISYPNNKTKHLIGTSQLLISTFNGEVPMTVEELIKLPGVGRKTANVVLGHAFDIPGITVDTHFGRLSRRFGWTKEMDPVKVERIVGELIPQKEWTNLSQRMIWHGRRICHSRKPACGACPLTKLCPSVGIGEMNVTKAKLLVKTDKDFR